MYQSPVQGCHAGALGEMDAAGQANNSSWQPETAHSSRRHKLGVASLGLHRHRDYCEVVLVCGISNSLDGAQDDLVSDDIPDADVEAEEDVDAEEDVGSDFNDMGDPFDSDPE